MNSIELLEVYEKVSAITSHMLEAARSNDWELLERLEQDCSAEVGTLRMYEVTSELPIELRERKISIIKRILADDRAIRELTEPWMQQLSNLMKSTNTSRKLSQTYGANQVG